MRKWIGIAAALFVLLAGVYVGSPYLAARNLKTAAIDGDADRLETMVDFPAVRESLKSQMSAAMVRKMQTDPSMKDNPFAGLGMLMLPTIINSMVDLFVTPDGIAALARGERPMKEKAASAETADHVEYAQQWVGLDRFRVRVTDRETAKPGPSFLFAREGFARWKLVKIELPEALFAEQAPAT